VSITLIFTSYWSALSIDQISKYFAAKFEILALESDFVSSFLFRLYNQSDE
jgi:hypothetical protein